MKRIALLATIGLSANQVAAQTVVTQWDQFSQAGITAAGPAMDELIKSCAPALGGAEVLRTVAPSIGIRDSYRLAVAAGKTPDLAYTWPAASVLAGYARTGALAPLDDYYAKYGWNHVNDFYRGRNSFEGHIFGLPMEQDLMGVYYNQALFEEHGVEVPTTYDEFVAAANAFKEAGIVPIAFGNRDRWPATNTFSLILGLTAGKQTEEQVFFGDTPWTNEQFVKAATVFQDWGKNEWFPRGFNGVGYDEANALFLSGRAAMTITGTWVIQDMIRGSDNIELAVFMLPPIAEGAKPGTMWGEGSQWQLSATADEATKEAAAAYLDCLVSDDSQRVWVQKGYTVPIGTTPDELTEWGAHPVVQSFFEQGLATPETNFYDLHTTLPESVTQVLYPELQRLAGGETTPEEFLQSMQTAWEAAIANGERWIP